MNDLIKIGVLELYQILFFTSILYVCLNIFNLVFKIYGNIKLNNKAKYLLNLQEKILLLSAIAIILSYLI